MNPSTTVGEVDEATIIDTLLAHYPRPDATGVELGAGDDAAVLAFAGGRVITTVDTLVEGQDFLRVWPCGYRTTGADVGFKSAAQNLSDINAMGAAARAGFVTLSLPDDVPLAWVEGYARGVAEAAAALGADSFGVLGGDLSAATELQIGMTVLGEAPGKILTRTGASPGEDLVLAGGIPGAAHTALTLLTSGAEADAVGQWEEADARVADAMFRPRPPLTAGPEAAGALTAGLDVSDGLVRDAGRLASASGVRLVLDPSAVDAEAEVLRSWAGRHADDARHAVLFGGEDFLLLGTAPAGARLPEGFRRIGAVHVGDGVWLGEEEISPEAGFDHFGRG